MSMGNTLMYESLRAERLSEKVVMLEEKLNEAKAEIERLALDVKILSEELERERLPKRDER
jgi:hypothetical protein